MNKADYDRALFYMCHSFWDDLLILMVRTNDDFLSKKIEHFLHAYYFSIDDKTVRDYLLDLLAYLEHARSRILEIQREILFSNSS
jgi:hypothetical protein